MRRKVLYSLLLVGLLLAIFIGLSMLWPDSRTVTTRVLPNPNGYDTLGRAASKLVTGGADYRKMPPEELRQLVADNTNALAMARAGLEQESVVDWKPSVSQMPDLGRLKSLAQMFAAESRWEGIEGRWTNAAKAEMDVVRLGPAISRGGVIIDLLVGIAIEQLGIQDLQAMREQLDAKTCREIARMLEELDANRPTWESVIKQERAWARQTFPGLRYRLAALLTSKSTKAAEAKFTLKFQESQRKTRAAILDFAARAYELEKGVRPSAPNDLVPDYLKTAPLDPTTGRQLEVYKTKN